MHARRTTLAVAVPVAVPALIAANLVVFALEIWLASGDGGAERLGRFVETFGLVPRELLRAASEPGRVQPGVWLTPVTTLFVHGGLLHLAANLGVLVFFGVRLEARLGALRLGLLYLACGIIAAAAQIAAQPDAYAATIGASGAVSGVLGACAVSARPRAGRTGLAGPMLLVLLAWLALQLGSGLGAEAHANPPVAWWAHLGGFAAGAVLGHPVWVRPPAASHLRT